MNQYNKNWFQVRSSGTNRSVEFYVHLFPPLATTIPLSKTVIKANFFRGPVPRRELRSWQGPFPWAGAFFPGRAFPWRAPKVQERRMMRRCFNLRLVCTSEITWEISRVSRGPSRGMSLLCVSLCVVGIFTVGGGWTCYGEWTSLRNLPVFQTSLRNFRIFPRQTSGITWETSRVSREPPRRMDLLCGKDRLAMCDG